MKKYFTVCGQPILLYSEDKKYCYYDIMVGVISIRRSLTVEMLKSSIKQIRDEWRHEGYCMRIVQDAICPSDIHLIPIKRDEYWYCKCMLNSIYGSMVR